MYEDEDEADRLQESADNHNLHFVLCNSSNLLVVTPQALTMQKVYEDEDEADEAADEAAEEAERQRREEEKRAAAPKPMDEVRTAARVFVSRAPEKRLLRPITNCRKLGRLQEEDAHVLYIPASWQTFMAARFTCCKCFASVLRIAPA